MRIRFKKLKLMKPMSPLAFKSGEKAFKKPIGYGLVGKMHNKFAYELWIYPLNLIVRFTRYVRKKIQS